MCMGSIYKKIYKNQNLRMVLGFKEFIRFQFIVVCLFHTTSWFTNFTTIKNIQNTTKTSPQKVTRTLTTTTQS